MQDTVLSVDAVFDAERERFPVLRNTAYMRTGSTGAVPDYVYDAVRKYQDDRCFVGGDSSWDGMNTIQMMDASKRALARMFNCRPDGIAFGLNSSSLMNIFVQGLGLGPGDNVVLSEDVFVSCRYAWQFAARGGLELRYVTTRGGALDAEDIAASCDESTKVVFLCHAESSTGFRADVENIGRYCRDNGILFALDVVHTAGAFPIDVEKQCIDFLAGNDYKWMMGFCGCGFAYFSPQLRRRIMAQGAGWMSDSERFNTEKKHFEQRSDAGKYELGYPNAPGIRALGLVAERYASLGAQNVERRILDLTDYFYQRARESGIELLYEFPRKNRSGLISLKLGAKSGVTVRELERMGVMVDGGVYGDGFRLRVSLHYFNSREDIDTLFDAIMTLMGGNIINF